MASELRNKQGQSAVVGDSIQWQSLHFSMMARSSLEFGDFSEIVATEGDAEKDYEEILSGLFGTSCDGKTEIEFAAEDPLGRERYIKKG